MFNTKNSTSNLIQPAIVTKFMPNGDLKRFLSNFELSSEITIRDILRFCRESVAGIQHLHTKKIIHRDIAARNCLLDENLRLKISDYGLAQEGNDYGNYDLVQSADDQEHNDKDQIPIRSVALEVFEELKFTTYSDIWALGILFWELFTRCKLPYAEMSNPAKILKFLKDGKRLKKPKACPDPVFGLMIRMWNSKKSWRPTIDQLQCSFNDFTANSSKFGILVDADAGHLRNFARHSPVCFR